MSRLPATLLVGIAVNNDMNGGKNDLSPAGPAP